MTGSVVGLPPGGLPAWLEFAGAVRAGDPRYARGTRLNPFVEQLFTEVVRLKRGSAGGSLQAAALTQVETAMAAWFAAVAVPQTHVIPCAIIPEAAAPFTVGPVRFSHASAFNAQAFGISPGLEDLSLGPMKRMMQERAASWIAIVDVAGYEQERSNEVAELAVDISLAALQLIIPLAYGSRAARITARTLPPFTAALVNTQGNVSPRVTNYEAGRGLGPNAFDDFMKAGASLLSSAGMRISSFVAGAGALSDLEMAWCNGAYWFHEALAEPLATVAVAKLETAVENLFGSPSLGESNSRIRKALKCLFGLNPHDPIAPGASVTVNAFVKNVVEARSRILHGNWSTLTEELAMSRGDVAAFARELLVSYTETLDLYSASGSPVDKVIPFLDWIEVQRASKAPPATPAPGP